MCDPETGVCSLCVTKVVITTQKALTVYGTMLISGELDGGGAGNEFTGQTAGYYALLELESKAQLYVVGTLHVPGFITESSENNESLITISRSATIYQPFVVRDFKGGTITGAIYNSIVGGLLGTGTKTPYSPFNEFSPMNVYATLDIYGSMIAYANIYATQQNSTIAPLVGLESNSFIQLKDENSHLVAKMNPETEVIRMEFYGGASVNRFSVTVNALGTERTMTSQQFVFPIAWMYDIVLHDGEYYMQNNNKFKLLPGAKLTVESDATLHIDYLNVYESFTYESTVKHYPRVYQEVPAVFIVNGALYAKKLGGIVYSTKNGATLKVSDENSLFTPESLTYPDKLSVLAGSGVSSGREIGSDVILRYKNANGSYDAFGYIKTNQTYNTKDNKWQGETGSESGNEGGNTGGGPCVTPDTLITLADGTQVRVDSLTGDELLLVWNLETGKLDFAPIMFVDSDPTADFAVIYLHFSDGTVVKVIGEHGFWDYDLNRYVYLDENAADFIGHYFAKQNGDELEKVQLINVEIKTELTTAWSPVTVGHLCYFVNGMLSMPGGVGGLFNIFEVDAETMTYDYDSIPKDIETYGLFTYEELNAICPLSEDMFNAAGGAYLKISIGKGNLTMEELIAMINRYSVYFE